MGGGKRTCRATQMAAPFPRNLSQAKEMTASKVTLQAAHVEQFNDLLRSIEPWQYETCRITIPEFVPAHNWVVALCANNKHLRSCFPQLSHNVELRACRGLATRRLRGSRSLATTTKNCTCMHTGLADRKDDQESDLAVVWLG